MLSWKAWIPGFVLTAGVVMSNGVVNHQSGPVPLRAPLAQALPVIPNSRDTDVVVGEEERKIAGMSSYVIREYYPKDVIPFQVYIGYYDEQHQGKTIHSPKNCLPGDGWEQVESAPLTVQTATGPVTINRWRSVKNGVSAMVYYWYQGRGRVENNEFKVKYELLRDAVKRGRTDEALVRIIVMNVTDNGVAADALTRKIAPDLVRDVYRVLPTF